MKSLQLFVVCLFATLGLMAQSEETLFNQTNMRLSGAWGSAAYNFSSFNGEDWTLIRGGYGGVEFGRDLFIGWGGWIGSWGSSLNVPSGKTGTIWSFIQARLSTGSCFQPTFLSR